MRNKGQRQIKARKGKRREGRKLREGRQSLTQLEELGFSTKTGNLGLKEEEGKNIKREHL